MAVAANLPDDGLAALFHDCAPTLMYMPKPLLPRLATVLAAQPVARERLKAIVTSSGAAQVEAEPGVRAVQFYGMTEGLIVYTRMDDPSVIRHGAIGWPVGHGDEVRILEPGTDCDPAGVVHTGRFPGFVLSAATLFRSFLLGAG